MADEEEIKVESGDGYSGGGMEKLTFREILMAQYQRCVKEGSLEMHRGGLKERTDPRTGEVCLVIETNQIAVHCNSIKTLAIMLSQKIAKHGDINGKVNEIGTAINNVDINLQNRIQELSVWANKEKKRMEGQPSKRDEYASRVAATQKIKINFARLDAEDRKHELYEELFLVITELLDNKLQFLQEGVGGMN